MEIDNNRNHKKPLAVFLHGFATSPTDLEMLADSFSAKGFEILTPWLPFHPFEEDSSESKQDFSVENSRSEIITMLEGLDHSIYDIYLVGFSLGGALAIDIASELELSGVLAINPFFEPTYKKLTYLYLNLLDKISFLPKKRRFQTTLKESRKYLSHENNYFPSEATEEVIRNSNQLKDRVVLSKCPIIIVHSLNDKISSFSASATAVKAAAQADIRLVPIHGLNHHMQFDVSPHALWDLALEHFSQKVEDNIDSNVLSSLFSEYQQESRHWAGIIFQLIVGFFTVFGALLAFTLPDVLQASWGETVGKAAIKALSNADLVKHQKAVAGAPYYLIVYSFILSLYLTLLSLYFFYLNRIDTFIRLHIEPLCNLAPWIQYRTRSEATGRTSRIMTNAVSIPIALIPCLASISLLIALPFIFPDRIFIWELRNISLHAFYFSSIVTSGFSAWSLIALQLHTAKITYGIPAPISTTLGIEREIRHLYSSVEKGAYGRIKKSL